MNYDATVRTNYFRVTDEEKYNNLIKGLSSFEDFTETRNGQIFHGFGSYEPMEFYKTPSMTENMKPYINNDECYVKNIITGEYIKTSEMVNNDIDTYEQIYDKDGNIIYDRDEQTPDFNLFVSLLQQILPENECFVYMESGHEGLRSVNGYALVATNNEIRYGSISKFVDETVKELLGKDATTQYTY